MGFPKQGSGFITPFTTEKVNELSPQFIRDLEASPYTGAFPKNHNLDLTVPIFILFKYRQVMLLFRLSDPVLAHSWPRELVHLLTVAQVF